MRPPFGTARAERDDQDATHKISLTRLCLRSGTLQLPFALWDALPEGEVTVRDLDAADDTVLRSQPPRRLSGLKPFFARHDVAVNDRLVLQIGNDVDLRLRVEAAPAAAPAREHSAEAEEDTKRAPHAPVAAAGDAPGAEPEVVERFGRVTVRRLGAGRSKPQVAPSEPAEPAPPAASPAPAAPVDRPEASPIPATEEHRPADPAPADDTPRRRAETGVPVPPSPAAPEPTPAPEARAQAERRAALNASGDLRTQVVRFLLRPDTPVIVSLERIATAFELSPEVAQEVMAGIVASPPPTLDVARIRDDHYRVARASKERETADS